MLCGLHNKEHQSVEARQDPELGSEVYVIRLPHTPSIDMCVKVEPADMCFEKSALQVAARISHEQQR